MKKIIIDKNESDQRLDRFLKKYLENASQGFIYKMLRKKNIKLNGKKANPDDHIMEGDIIDIYLADETVEKFIATERPIKSKLIPNIVYEDENIILMNKKMGILSHGAGGEFEENIVDSMISYLIEKKEYIPRIEKTFTPSICNRLDRNTSGIIIGAKNYQSLKAINEALRSFEVRRFYKTIVKGRIDKNFKSEGYLSKDEDRNKVEVTKDYTAGSKKIVTYIKVLEKAEDFSLLEIELITGRTHQIRGHLSSLGYPVIGDRKYGDKKVNKKFQTEYDLENQYLHGYKIEFNGLKDSCSYLNGKSFESPIEERYAKIERDLFQEVKSE